MVTHAAPTCGEVFSLSIILLFFTQHAERERKVSQDKGPFNIYKYVFNSHPSALPHLYHSAWQKIAKDPYTMNFTLETLNLT